MELYLSESDHPNVEDLDLDDTVEMVVKGRVSSVSRPDLQTGAPLPEGEGKRVTIDIVIEELKRKEVSLKEALARAGEKEGLLVRTHVSPAP